MVSSKASSRGAYRLLVRSALDLMEPWARELLGVKASSTLKRLAVRGATHVLCRLVRLFVPPPER